ncbi:MAG: transcription termination/antitermination protein NusA [Bacteroidetes bacterium]|nr:MAG: transcription termination/antitermination protein NusA [Bacteroidota bacterium]
MATLTKNLIESFEEFKEAKGIDKTLLMSILVDVIKHAIAKKHGKSNNYDVIINPDKGDIEIWRNKTIVDDEFAEDSFDYDPDKHISLSEARKIDETFEVGEQVSEQVSLESFGRRTILAMRQHLIQKINELEKAEIYNKYKDKVGEIVSAEVYQIWKNEIMFIDEEGNELIMPRKEQIPTDFFKKGDIVKAVITKVEMKGATPIIQLSRTSPVFLERLFEQEVPEIYDGIIVIKKIVRQPGEKAKVAVESLDERIDPVGACVGIKGSRIHGIVKELRNENIDVINYSTNPQLYVQRALSPAKVSQVIIDEEKKKAEVYLRADQIPIAIGKDGINIKLASKLTGYDIDVYKEEAEELDDVELTEFTDEIDETIIAKLKEKGLDTARQVLNYPNQDLMRITQLDEETINKIKSILQAEFEE